jgi:hypothetical protein
VLSGADWWQFLASSVPGLCQASSLSGNSETTEGAIAICRAQVMTLESAEPIDSSTSSVDDQVIDRHGAS